MAFSILNKKMLENDDIKRIVTQLKDYEAIFNLNQQRNFGFDFYIGTRITLKEYDSVKNEGVLYLPYRDVFIGDIDDYGYIYNTKGKYTGENIYN